jgi:hypothetical protein
VIHTLIMIVKMREFESLVGSEVSVIVSEAGTNKQKDSQAHHLSSIHRHCYKSCNNIQYI